MGTEDRTCRKCGAAIRWGYLVASSRWTPLDVGESERGNLVAMSEQPGGSPGTRVLNVRGRKDSDSGPFYVSHFATCPNAGDFRGKRRRNAEGRLPGVK